MTTNTKTAFYKMWAVCLALALVLSMSITAFASITQDTTGQFTVTGFDTDPSLKIEVSAFQIITVNVDNQAGQPAYPMYTWNANVAAWMRTNGYEQYINDTLGKNAVADQFDPEQIAAKDMTVFLEKITAAIKAGTILLTATKTVEASEGSAVFTEMPMGEYLITAKGGVKIYQPTTAELVPRETEGEWEIVGEEYEMKSTDPGITEKEGSTEEGDQTVAIGDTVNYMLTVRVPSYPADASHTKFEVSDSMSSGLTFDGADSIQVYSDKEKTNPISDDNYTVTVPSETRTFSIAFKDQFTRNTELTTIYIVYSATVNPFAFEEDALGNQAFLGYSNDPYTESDYETPGPEEDVYTYGIALTKIDKDHNSVTAADGDKRAQFTLSDNGTALTFTETETDGVYRYDANGSTTLEVAADGTLLLQGLDEGTYILKETQAPEGYVLPTGEITIVITDQEDGAADGMIDAANVTSSGTITICDPSVVDNAKNVVDFHVVNTSSEDAGFTLPVTGGMGTLIFTVAGVLLMAGAVVMVVLAKKKQVQ